MPSVLVIDDEAEVRDSIRQVVGRAGFDCCVVGGIRRALDRRQAANYQRCKLAQLVFRDIDPQGSPQF